MKTLLVGDRLGGVLFDVQQYRGMMATDLRAPPVDRRTQLIACIANLVSIVEEMDDAEIHPNPRIGFLRDAPNPEHGLYRQRKADCSECRIAESCSRCGMPSLPGRAHCSDTCFKESLNPIECMPPIDRRLSGEGK